MLRIISSNRQELLFERLATRIALPADGNPLAAEVIVAERGTDTWLWQQLAERDGIAANLDLQMPGGFIWKTLRTVLPDLPQESPFDTAPVAWRLMGMLPALLEDAAFTDLRHYLCADIDDENPPEKIAISSPDPRRLYQLCTRIAGVFDQYQIYRPDWIAAWEADRLLDLGPDERWQKTLWQALVAALGKAHRAQLLLAFEAHYQSGKLQRGDLPARVSVFGIPALPPAYMHVLTRLANVIDIDFYLLNPSTLYWGDLLTPAQAANTRAQLGEHGAALVDVPNRLLASWGQQTRDFIADLHGLYGNQCATEYEDLPEEPLRDTRLSCVHADILALNETAHAGITAADASIQLHSTHSRMREVEVLHDQLLAQFHDIADLHPRDVLVLAPDISQYAPLIDAVFGTASGLRRIPWAIADLPQRAEEPLLAAIEQLLQLPASRLRASDVLALLEMPAIRRAARIEDDQLDDIRHWVAVANIRWGYDGDARAAIGLPPENAHTWAFGLRRLFLGAAVSGREALLDGVAPCTQVEGQRAAALGLLCSFVDALHAAQPLLAGTASAGALTPAQWRSTVTELLATFVQAGNDNEQDVVDICREALAAQQRELQAAGMSASPLSADVLRDDFIARLAAPGRRNDFLSGSVTFASLVPMRSLPFRVVALLGMNQEEFPRQQNAVGFDLLARQPRAGDRSRRHDDRQLFLETLLSARDVLYISYIGRDIRDDKTRLPSVLVSELVDYLAEASAGSARKARKIFRAQLVREHPLQPFSARYFLPWQQQENDRAGTGKPLFTFNTDWQSAASARAGSVAGNTPAVWCSAPLPARTDDAADDNTVSVDELIRFLRNPAAAFLQQRLGIRFRDEHDVPVDDEPFELDALEGWQVKRDWINASLAGTRADVFRRELAARGELPEGPLESLHWQQQRDSVSELVTALRERGTLTTVAIDVMVGKQRLTGQVPGVSSSGLVAWKPGSIDGKDALACWVRHLALCAQGELPEDAVTCLFALDKRAAKVALQLHVLAAADAQQELAALLTLRERGRDEPLPLFPKANWKWLRSKPSDAAPDKAADDARDAFDGNRQVRGDALDPAIRIAWRNGDMAIGPAFLALAEAVYGPIRRHEVQPEKPAKEEKAKKPATKKSSGSPS